MKTSDLTRNIDFPSFGLTIDVDCLHDCVDAVVDDRLAKAAILTSRLRMAADHEHSHLDAYLDYHVYVLKSLLLLDPLSVIYHGQSSYTQGQVRANTSRMDDITMAIVTSDRRRVSV